MDSRASTSTATKPKPLTINTTNHAAMASSKTFSPPPSSSCMSFRPSPLNPTFTPSPTDKPAYLQRRSPTFPASRPLRPFPSIAQSLASPKHARDDVGVSSKPPAGDGLAAAGKRSSKTIEISSKWKGGFFVLGMTQAEFSRRD